MPNRKRTVRARGADSRHKPLSAQPAVTVMAGRARLMEEIARLRHEREGPAEFLDKARTLLTTHWGRATWLGREGLLKTATWLIEVERLHGPLVSPGPFAAPRP